MSRPAALELSESALNAMSKDECLNAVRELSTYVRQLEARRTNRQTSTNATVSPKSPTGGTVEDRLRQQQLEASRRENVLVMRLTTKEQEVQEYLAKLEDMRMSAASTARTVLLDPAVNVMFQRMKAEAQQARELVEQTRQELNAWKFTRESNTGKLLMARCRTLIQENEELGKMCSSGVIGKLEGDLAMTRSLCDQLRKCQDENYEFLMQQDEDMEGLQSTIMFLQGQLKTAKSENQRLRTALGFDPDAKLDEVDDEPRKSAVVPDSDEPMDASTADETAQPKAEPSSPTNA